MAKNKAKNSDKLRELVEKVIEEKLKSVIELAVKKTIEHMEKRELAEKLKSRREKNPYVV